MIWILILRYYFPHYLDPFVPYHNDHYVYLGNSAEPYSITRYILFYPRPLGNLLFDLIGRLGIRGMLVPVFVMVLANMCLLISYIERVTDRLTSLLTVSVFFLLVFGNPESYSSTKEDILASVCFFCSLVICHLWQNFLTSRRMVNLILIVAIAFLSTYMKETYFATNVTFFAVQAWITRANVRRTAITMAVTCAVFAGLSLAYNAHISVFVNLHADRNGPYYQDRSIPAILHGYRVLLRWLLRPVPTLLVLAGLVLLFLKARRDFAVGAVSLLLAATTLLPHSILPNHLEDQYAWLAAGFFFVPVLLSDQFLPTTRTATIVAVAAAVMVCALSLRSYRKNMGGRMGWVLQQEAYQRNLLTSWSTIKRAVRGRENELVVGVRSTFSPFQVPSFLLKSFGGEKHWTVVVTDSIPTSSSRPLTTMCSCSLRTTDWWPSTQRT